MARITPLTGRRAPLVLRLLNRGIRRRFGQEMAPLAIMAYNPRFILAYLGTGQFVLGRTRLDTQLRTLAMQLVAATNGCAWCIDFGQSVAEREGILPRKMAEIMTYADNALFSPAERFALEYAEAMTRLESDISDDLFARLRQHFDEREIVELTAAIATENMYNRFNKALGVESQGFCAVPSLHPLTRRAA
ncbi:MAG: carboxymuconolactone decarboxylase family protein [Chloroflexota bacterium]|nr:carboxymuconolactone decarboxylase family protein [Chloroflexota bacterium]